MAVKPTWICYNGRFTQAPGDGFPGLNRAFRLGDGFFESLRVIEGAPHLWDAHWARIKACAKLLKLDIPGQYTAAYFLERISELIQHNGFTAGARLRITFFREGAGAYKPQTLRMGFLMEMTQLDNKGFNVREEGIHLGLYSGMAKHRGSLAKFKLLGGHVYIQASIWAAENGFDDALIINDQGEIIEGISSNLFAIRGGELHTPSLGQGCVGGVMRMAAINEAMKMGMPCFESEISIDDLLSADEVFLTNAVNGLMWVRSFKEKRYYHKVSDRLISRINESHSRTLNSATIN